MTSRIDEETHERARIRTLEILGDASIVVAASRGGCATLLSEDLHHGQRSLDVEIANPFL